MLSGLHDWLERRRAMREIRSNQRRDERDYGIEFIVMMEDAEAAVRLGELDRAWDVWQRARLRFPNTTLASRAGLQVLMDVHRFEEAEALMREGCRRFSRDQFYYEGLALISQRRRDHAEALARSAVIRRKFPGNPMGYSIAANAFRALGQPDEAKACLRRGMGYAPTNVNLWLDAGQLAIDAADWDDGLTIFTKAGRIFRHIAVPIGLSRCLSGLGRYNEAERELREAQAGYPTDLAPWAELARLAEARGDWATADTHWGVVRRRFPMSTVGFLEGRRALHQLGRDAEIEPMFAEAVERIQDDSELAAEYARIAHGAGDWAAAADRWALVRERFPERREGWDRGAEALSALGREAEAAEVRASVPH